MSGKFTLLLAEVQPFEQHYARCDEERERDHDGLFSKTRREMQSNAVAVRMDRINTECRASKRASERMCMLTRIRFCSGVSGMRGGMVAIAC